MLYLEVELLLNVTFFNVLIFIEILLNFILFQHLLISFISGGTETEDLAKCSILVTDKVRRTFKFLCSLARGIPIVSVKWLDDSNKANTFLDWDDYILKDGIAESKFKFHLKESLAKAKEHKLLEGYSILLTPHITQPPVSELKGEYKF